MSTNYYLRPHGACPAQCSNWIHLGSSSLGWAFTFRAYPKRAAWDDDPASPILVVTDYASWLAQLKLGEIYDEYGKPVTADDLVALIVHKRGGRKDLSRSDYLDDGGNHFVPEEFS
jgi:hypothetical protein